ncbi:MAG: hypothetical protein HGA85_04915 [Nanoarchaeota archaeon]|nr:hypothetical protein [Nanoarchaeota archaeon]
MDVQPDLASTVISVIVPFLIKGGEEIAKGVGKELLDLVKSLFTSAKDKAIVQELEQKPEDQRVQGKAELKLAELIENRPDVAEQINKILPKAQSEVERVTILIRNSKNVIVSSQISAGGDITVGDTFQPKKHE